MLPIQARRRLRRRRRGEPRTSAAPPSLDQLVQDAIGEILLRVSPEDPADIVRAAAVCKTWRRAAAEPSFAARYRSHHRAAGTSPTVLGAFRTDAVMIPATSFLPAAAGYGYRKCHVLDCRHGRVVLESLDDGEITVWDPITGDEHVLPAVPGDVTLVCNIAVLCAAAGNCDHLSCHTGPFLVAMLGASADGQMHGSVYLSETGAWGPLASVELYYLAANCITVDIVPAAPVGNALYFIGDFGSEILRFEYDPEEPFLSVVEAPDVELCCNGVVLVPEADGRLGFAFIKPYQLHMWSVETGPDGEGEWEHRWNIDLMLLIPEPVPSHHLSGFVDGSNTIVVITDNGVYTIELGSFHTRPLCKRDMSYSGFLYTGFFVPECRTGLGLLPPPAPAAAMETD
ncbi:unnamed protein product [Urochloa decumbens]|uniref:F-box domain-containing protein n=1 Tax=Urochloa decumbens TaxID=240449 RepID=A0ABC9H9G5_9POAL